MRWRNTPEVWGLAAIVLHWLIAFALLGLFGLGLWMTGLDYYHPWYRQGPDLHRSIGVLLLLLVILRLLWRRVNVIPVTLPNHRRSEVRAAQLSHLMLYLLPIALAVSGYLISTADGRSLSVFGLIEVPALNVGLDQQEETMGDIHAVLAWSLIAVAGLHAMGALKHHLIDRDTTLTRMLGRQHRKEKET